MRLLEALQIESTKKLTQLECFTMAIEEEDEVVSFRQHKFVVHTIRLRPFLTVSISGVVEIWTNIGQLMRMQQIYILELKFVCL